MEPILHVPKLYDDLPQLRGREPLKDWRADPNGYPGTPKILPAAEWAAATTTEWVSIKSADVHGNNGRAGTVENSFEAAPEGADLSIP